MKRVFFVALLSSLLCVGCANESGPDGTFVDSGSTLPDTSNSVDSGVGTMPDSTNAITDVEGSTGGLYPPGPYGVNEGEILEEVIEEETVAEEAVVEDAPVEEAVTEEAPAQEPVEEEATE